MFLLLIINKKKKIISSSQANENLELERIRALV